MKMRILISIVLVSLLFAVSCQKENISNSGNVNDELLTTVGDEVLADISFADLLNEGDDGIFWGDAAFSSILKSAENEDGNCPHRTKLIDGNEVLVTLTYSGEDCEKSGVITIEYLKPKDHDGVKEKTITYEDFIKHGVTYNGTKNIVHSDDNYNIKGEMTINKVNDKGEEITLSRSYNRQVHWICGFDTKRDNGDNIIKVTGSAEVNKTVGDNVVSYSRQILDPLLIVKACDLKIQAGSVKIKKSSGTEIVINYGEMPNDINCDSTFDCGTQFEVTKNGKTYQMELVEGKRVKVVGDE